MTRNRVDERARLGDVLTIPGHPGKWVVERAEMTGGGIAQGGDVYPDAWHVWARRLGAGGRYVRKAARVITFTQNTSSYNDCIRGVQVVGKMEMTFVPVKGKGARR